MATSTETAWSTAKVYAALRAYFKLPEYALLTEVANATGYAKSRSADALAMSCWPSRGLSLIGIEIKVSRSDWIKELRNPAKADAVCRYCDAWVIVAGSKGIVPLTELPLPWGLMEPKGDKFVIVKSPAPLTPEPISREFLAAILRRAAEDTGSRDVFLEEKQAAVKKAFDEGKASGEAGTKYEIRTLKDEAARTKAVLDRVAKETGFHLTGYSDREFIEAVKLVKEIGLVGLKYHIRNVEQYATETLAAVTKWREEQGSATPREQEPDSCQT